MIDKDRKEHSPENYVRENLGQAAESSEDFKKAYRAWLSYMDQLESYAQRVCRGREESGLARPQTTEEMRLCNQKARLLRQELIEPIRAGNIKSETEASARQLAEREHDRKWRRK